jgi:diguanylate cyclase (GGDEF)-like protein/PAS domain S-box-containing protein
MTRPTPPLADWSNLDAYAWLNTPVWVFDVERLSVLWANNSALRLWQAASLQELQQRDFSDITPASKTRLTGILETLARGDSVSQVQTVYPVGRPVTLNLHHVGILLKDGRVAMLSEGHPVSPEALSPALRRDLAALNQTSSQISIHRADGTAVMRNAAAVVAFGPTDEHSPQDDLATQVGGAHNASDLRQALSSAHTFSARISTQTRQGERWHDIEVHGVPDPDSGADAILLSADDVTEAQLAQQRLAMEKRVLEHISSGRPLAEVLTQLALAIERLSPGMLCSVLLLDPSGRLRMGAAPSLPASYNERVDGLPIGEGVGSCGTAAWRGETVVASDIATDPLWVNGRTVALTYGLRACWSVPIKAAGGVVLGTFAAYYRQPQAPRPAELELLETARNIASVAIERARSHEQLLERQELLTALIDSVPAMICYADCDSRVLDINQRYAQWLGLPRAEIIGKRVNELMDAELLRAVLPHIATAVAGQEVRYERRQRGQDGRMHDFEVNYVPHFGRDHEVIGYFVMINDATERKRDEQMLYFLANHDQLTSLPNRNLLLEHLNMALAQAARSGERVAALFIDLDRFKNVNDTLGHHVGDALLQQVAQRFRSCLRVSDLVARLGGDEYTVMVRPVDDVQEVAALAQKLLGVLGTAFIVDSHELFVTGSIGISIYPDDACDAPALLKNADIAMYRAKAQGKNTYQFFSSEATAATFEHLMLETSLRRALERSEFVLHFQPIVDLASGRRTGMETLIRWQHPELGMVSPAKFIPLAEETGLIVPIGQWVLEHACRQTKALQEQGFPDLHVSVNLSPRQFRQRDLVQSIAQTLQRVGLRPGCLELEVTESSVMDNADSSIGTLHQLKSMGVRLSIDDFGTGYSSLSYLKRFPIDALKVDQSFVRDITSDPGDAAIARAVIALGHSLRLTIVAEGVETQEQLEFLRKHECHQVQGYLLGRPMPASLLPAALREQYTPAQTGPAAPTPKRRSA